ncbi:MAG: hypothetical protein PHP29_00135 [Tissierellia bacterium]|nr:hypothetical protein [Tissierellia bacterium]
MSDIVVTTNHEKSADVIVAKYKRRTEQLNSMKQNGCNLDNLIDTGENVK